MGKRSELEPQAIERFAAGMEIPQISIELGVSENSLRDWKKRAGNEWDEARSNFRKGQTASFEDFGKRVARAKQIADRIGGDAKIQSKLGLGLNQGIQTMLVDIMEQMETNCLIDPDKLESSLSQIQRVASILQKTEQAANLNLKREKEIRQQALEDAAKAVETTGKQAGISPETIEIIRRDVLRIAS